MLSYQPPHIPSSSLLVGEEGDQGGGEGRQLPVTVPRTMWRCPGRASVKAQVFERR